MIHDFIRHDPGVLRIDHDEYLGEDHIIFPRDLAPPPPTFVERLRQKAKRWINHMKSQAQWNQVMITQGKKEDFGGGENVGKDFYGKYGFVDSAAGVNVYVFDSGIKIEHEAFTDYGGRKIASHFGGKKTSDTSPYCGSGVTMDDALGHGTHVAAIIANRNSGPISGVTEKANLINVKIQKCGGSIGKAETAVNDVITEHNNNKKAPPKGWKGSVINMSIGFVTQNFQGLQDALNSAKRAGIPIAAAAGNNKQDWLEIPARFAFTFSVGAIDIEYNRWQGGYAGIRGSNYHKKLNIWAPGKSIYSAFIDENDPKVTNKYEWASGTSMACPHVAGTMAIIMGYEGYSKLTAQDVYDRLNDNVIKAVNSDSELTRVGATLNLLQTGIKGGTRRPITSDPYDGVGHDELKLAVRSATTLAPVSSLDTPTPSAKATSSTAISPASSAATTSVDPSISVDNTPMPTQAPPANDNEDMDEMIVVDDGTDPNDPYKGTDPSVINVSQSASQTSTAAPSSTTKA